MKTFNPGDYESHLRAQGAISREMIEELRVRQGRHASAAIASRAHAVSKRLIRHRPDLSLAGRVSRRPTLKFYSGDSWPPGLMCLPGFKRLSSAIEISRYGSDSAPRLGPVISPPPDGFEDGPPLHAFSVMTRDETSEISIAAAIAFGNFPNVTVNSTSNFRGYEIANHPYGNGDPAVGWMIGGSISQMFYLPDLPASGVTQLEASALVSNDHLIDDLVTAYIAFSPDNTDPNITVQGFVTLKVYEGLASLFGGTSPTFASLNKLFEYEYDRNFGRYGPGSRMQDGIMDIDVLLPYDGASTVFIVEASVIVDVHLAPDGPSGMFAAFDARFADDDRTIVVADGVRQSTFASNPQSSCPFTVLDIAMCGRAS